MAGTVEKNFFVGLLAVDSTGNHGKIISLDEKFAQFRLRREGTVVQVDRRELTPNFEHKSRQQQGFELVLHI